MEKRRKRAGEGGERQKVATSINRIEKPGGARSTQVGTRACNPSKFRLGSSRYQFSCNKEHSEKMKPKLKHTFFISLLDIFLGTTIYTRDVLHRYFSGGTTNSMMAAVQKMMLNTMTTTTYTIFPKLLNLKPKNNSSFRR